MKPCRPSQARRAAILTAMLLAGGGLPAAPAKPEAANPTPAVEAITAADIRKLQESLEGLRQRFEDQGKILRQYDDNLGTLTKRVDDYLLPSTLEPLRTGLGSLTKRIQNLEEAVGKLAEAQNRQPAELAARLQAITEISTALVQLQQQVADADKRATADLTQLRQAIAASRASSVGPPAPTRTDLSVVTLLAATAGGTLLLAGLLLLQDRRHQRALLAAREHLLAELATGHTSLRQEIRTGRTDTSGVPARDNLDDLRITLQHLLQRLDQPATAVHHDDHTTREFPVPPVADEHPTTPIPAPAGPAACWPPAFFEPASPLAQWCAELEAHRNLPEYPAQPVFAAMLSLRALLDSRPAPSLEDVGTAISALSQALHAYWESRPDLGEDLRTRASSDWRRAVKSLVAPVAPKLEIREVLPGDRFDSDTMQTVAEGSGNRLNVAAVHSWVILDQSRERIQVLRRARVATT